MKLLNLMIMLSPLISFSPDRLMPEELSQPGCYGGYVMHTTEVFA